MNWWYKERLEREEEDDRLALILWRVFKLVAQSRSIGEEISDG